MKTPETGFHVSLSPEEIEALERLAKQESGPRLRRARIVMLAGHGKSITEITDAVQLSSRQVRYWLKEYQARGLDIFPQSVFDLTQAPRQLPVPLTDRPGLRPDDPMSEAGRKVFAYYFARMLAQEDAVRREIAADPVHDMRVAIRRLRSALKMFAPFYRKRAIKSYRQALKKVARALGAVRDLDVLWAKTEEYLEALPADSRSELNVLLEDWQSQLNAARARLIKTLDSHRYARFIADFAAFVATPQRDAIDVTGSGQPAPYLVRHVAPRLIYERYTTVRAYETALPGAPLNTLHRLRIEAKRLRYALEAFEEALGPEAENVIDSAKKLQAHLGNLQDAQVAVAALQRFIQEADAQLSTAGIVQYLAAREEEKHRLLSDIPQAWEAFTHPNMRSALALAVSIL
jgi:CHAD domain-containing protein